VRLFKENSTGGFLHQNVDLRGEEKLGKSPVVTLKISGPLFLEKPLGEPNILPPKISLREPSSPK